jgi:hypothetical protein
MSNISEEFTVVAEDLIKKGNYKLSRYNFDAAEINDPVTKILKALMKDYHILTNIKKFDGFTKLTFLPNEKDIDSGITKLDISTFDLRDGLEQKFQAVANLPSSKNLDKKHKMLKNELLSMPPIGPFPGGKNYHTSRKHFKKSLAVHLSHRGKSRKNSRR